MSEKVPITERKVEYAFLKKKTLRRRKLIAKKKERDQNLLMLKEKLLNELKNDWLNGVNMYTNEETKETNGINVNQNLAHEYYKETKKYYLNNMGFNLYNYINQMVINNTTIPNEIKCEINLQKVLVKVFKNALFNEVEILNFAVFLDKFGWKHDELDIEKYLNMVALAIKVRSKKKLNDEKENEKIFAFFSKNEPELIKKLNVWWDKQKIDTVNISQKELNNKCKLLGRSANSLCKFDFIDYNFIVDNILKMSIPYSETKQHHEKHIHQNNITENSKEKTGQPQIMYMYPPYPMYMPMPYPYPYPQYQINPNTMYPNIQLNQNQMDNNVNLSQNPQNLNQIPNTTKTNFLWEKHNKTNQSQNPSQFVIPQQPQSYNNPQMININHHPNHPPSQNSNEYAFNPYYNMNGSKNCTAGAESTQIKEEENLSPKNGINQTINLFQKTEDVKDKDTNLQKEVSFGYMPSDLFPNYFSSRNVSNFFQQFSSDDQNNQLFSGDKNKN